jgi:tetratricopeptide (TPR) repeat protein
MKNSDMALQQFEIALKAGKTGNYEQSLEQIDKALAIDSNQRYLIFKFNLLCAMFKYDEAISFATKLIELDPQNATFYILRSEAFEQLASQMATRAAYNRVAIDQKEITNLFNAAFDDQQEAYKLPVQKDLSTPKKKHLAYHGAYISGRVDAIRKMQSRNKIGFYEPVTTNERNALIMNMGRSYEHLERYQDAKQYYEQLLDAEDEKTEALSSLQRIHFYLKNYEESIKYGKLFFENNKSNTQTQKELYVKSLYIIGEYDDVAEYVDANPELFQVDMESEEVYIIIADVLHWKGEYEKEKSYIEKRIINNPNLKQFIPFYQDRLNLLNNCTDLPRAYTLQMNLMDLVESEARHRAETVVSESLEFIKLAPNVYEGYKYLAIGYAWSGQYEKVVDATKQGIQLQSENRLFEELGHALVRLGRKNEFEQLLTELETKYKIALEQQEKIKQQIAKRTFGVGIYEQNK